MRIGIGKSGKLFLSPYFLILYQLFLLIFSITLNPVIYTYYIDEPNLMYKNASMFLLVMLDIFSFSIGVFLSYMLPLLKTVNLGKFIYIPKKSYYIIPLIIPQIMVILFILKFLKDNWNYLDLILINATVYKNVKKVNFFYFSIFILIGALFWVIKRKKHTESNFLQLLIMISIVEVIISSILMVDRALIIPFIIGLFVIYYSNCRKLGIKKLLFTFSIIGVVFITYGYFRQGMPEFHDASYLLTRQVLGYTFASYNRLAALLNGDLTYYYAKTGYYLFPFLAHVPLLHYILPNVYGVTPKEVWLQEFNDIVNSPLVPEFIWSTIYGYIFSVLGWFSPIFFAFVGILTGYMWRNFHRNKTLGIIMYPWIYACIILLFAGNIIFFPHFIALLYSFMFIIFWETLFHPKIPTNRS